MTKFTSLLVLVVAVLSFALVVPATASAADVCGSKDTRTKLAIDIGCRGEGNAIADMLFALIRIISSGVGLVIVASLIVAGIQYTTAGGDPQGTVNAVKRIRSNVFALILFIFGYAIINYLVPNGFL